MKEEIGSSVIPRNLGLLELVRAKREWCWKPSIEELRQGFRGWHQRGYLPHFDAPRVTQMVTFTEGSARCTTRSRGFLLLILLMLLLSVGHPGVSPVC
jgi:hypothetical protein